MGNVIVNFTDTIAGIALMASESTPKARLPDGREFDLMARKNDRVQSILREFGLANVNKLHAKGFHRGNIYITLDLTSIWTVYFGFQDYCGSTNTQCGFSRNDTPEAIYFRLKERLTNAQRRIAFRKLINTSNWNISLESWDHHRWIRILRYLTKLDSVWIMI